MPANDDLHGRILETLGGEAEYLLDHKCATIDSSAIYAPGPDFIDRVVSDSDRPVPIERNAAELVRRYRELGGEAELIVVPGKGHEEAKEIFQRQQLVDFAIEHAHRTGLQD